MGLWCKYNSGIKRNKNLKLKLRLTSIKLHLDYDRDQMEDLGQTEINVSWRY